MKGLHILTILLATFATSSLVAVQAIASNQQGNFCQGCRKLVSYVVDFNSSTEIRNEYKGLVKDFCEIYYPVSTDYQQGPCPLFTESLFYVIDNIDPVHHCDQIGACSPLGSSQSSARLPVSNNELPTVDGNGGVVCDVCEQIIQQLKDQIEDQRFIRDLRNKVNAFCDFLKPIKQDQECRDVLAQNIDAAVNFISHIEPKRYCRSIRLCSDAQSVQISNKKSVEQLPSLADFNDFGLETSVEIGNKQIRGVERGPDCKFCKMFVKEAFKFLKDKRTEKDIREALETVCSLIYRSGINRRHCEDLVSVYSRELIELLMDETDPEMICMILGQCTYQKLPLERPVVKMQQTVESHPNVTMGDLITMLDPSVELGSLKVCVECKLFIKYLQSEFEDPTSEEEIKNWLLRELCNSLPNKDVEDSCVSLVNSYSETFFKAVAEQLDPQAVCMELEACRRSVSSSSISRPKTTVKPNKPRQSPSILVSKLTTTTGKPSDGALCEKCVEIVTKIDEYLSTHPVDHDISVLIDQVCNKIQAESTRNECINLVKTFGQYLVQAISTMDNPRQLCSTIALC